MTDVITDKRDVKAPDVGVDRAGGGRDTSGPGRDWVRLPESWIPPAHVVEMRTLGRLYCALMDERRAWQQRIHAQLFYQAGRHSGAAVAGRGDTLARAELSAVGRQYVDTALRRIGELSTEIDLLRTQLASFAKHQAGCRALRLVHQEPDWTADSV